MLGNRQQSRFIALVSDYERLSELTEEAANSEDAATLQTLKTLDSLESKIQQLKTAWQGFYANMGLEELFKGIADLLTKVLNNLNQVPKLFGKIPAAAISIVASLVNVIKLLGTHLLTQIFLQHLLYARYSVDWGHQTVALDRIWPSSLE